MTTARRAPALQRLPLTGGQLQTSAMDLAKLFGLHTAHFRPARTKDGEWRTAVAGDGKGWPDLVIVGPGGVLFREIKRAAESLSPEQAVWIAVLEAAGADVAVWRPADLHSGRIERELRALRRARPEGPMS